MHSDSHLFRYLNMWILNFDLPTILSHPFKLYLLQCLGICHSLQIKFFPCSYSIYPFCNQFLTAASWNSITKLLNSQTGSAALCMYGFYVQNETWKILHCFNATDYLMIFCDMAETRQLPKFHETLSCNRMYTSMRIIFPQEFLHSMLCLPSFQTLDLICTLKHNIQWSEIISLLKNVCVAVQSFSWNIQYNSSKTQDQHQ